MKEHMEIGRRTWIAAIKLAAVISTIAALAAVAVSTIGHVPDGAIVAVVAVVAFTVSWVQTGRLRNGDTPARVVVPGRISVPAR